MIAADFCLVDGRNDRGVFVSGAIKTLKEKEYFACANRLTRLTCELSLLLINAILSATALADRLNSVTSRARPREASQGLTKATLGVLDAVEIRSLALRGFSAAMLAEMGSVQTLLVLAKDGQR